MSNPQDEREALTDEIKEAFVAQFGDDRETYLGRDGSWYIEGFKAARQKYRAALANQRAEAGVPQRWCPDVCPITGLPFFMWIEHHKTGEMVPTYGGPYDSYTIPVHDGEGYTRERYDHDLGGWVVDEVEDVGVQIVGDQAYVYDEERPLAAQPEAVPQGGPLARYKLSIVANTGYEAVTEGTCTPEQYGAAIGALCNAAPPSPQPPAAQAYTHADVAQAHADGYALGLKQQDRPPAAQAPMTAEQVKSLLAAIGYDKDSARSQADFVNGLRHAEAHHGIGTAKPAPERVALTPSDEPADYGIEVGDEVTHDRWTLTPLVVVAVNWALGAVALRLGEDGGVVIWSAEGLVRVSSHGITAPAGGGEGV